MLFRTSATWVVLASALIGIGVGVVEQLRPPALRRLVVGATRPKGWLMDEMTLQAKGITGQLPYFWWVPG